MIDFTVKGTKLPTIPAGTEYSCGTPKLSNFECSRSYLVSFGSEWINGERYVKAENSAYIGKNFWYVKLWDIEQLAKEQGMTSKELPKFWVVKCNTTHPDWMKVVDYMNTIGYTGWTWNGTNDGDYYGFDGVNGRNGTHVWSNLLHFKNNPTVLTIEEFVSLTNKKEDKMVTIKREQLQEIHTIACSDWKMKIREIAKDQPFGDIELAEKTVDTMFKAATATQLPVLENIFGARSKDINLKTQDLDAKVDGISIFGNSEMGRSEAFIGLPKGGSLGFNTFYLNTNYKWTYDPATETLTVNHK